MDSPDEGISSGSSVIAVQERFRFRQGPYVLRTQNAESPSANKLPLNSKISKYETEGEHASESWLSHSCHIVVITYSGKPVYARYGGEDLIAGFSGTLQALVSKFIATGLSSGEDRLRCMSLGSMRIEFLDKSPLILVCMSRRRVVPRESLRRLLAAVHSQLIFVLTSGINNTLLSRPGFDVRTLLGGTKPLLGNLISWMNRDMLLAIEDAAIEPLPLPLSSRSNVMKAMQETCPDSCFLGLLLAGHRVVATVGGQNSHISLAASDVIMLINLVISSTSLRSSESWTPICLPSLSAEAFVYAYVQFFNSDISYVCVSLSPDNANFYAISNHAESVKNRLNDELVIIQSWESQSPLSLSTFPDVDGTVEKQEALARVRHCAIVLNQSKQIFSSRISGKNDKQDCKDVFRNYQQVMAMLKSATDGASQQVSMTHKSDFVFVWTTSEFQLFLTAPRGIDVSVITYVYQWMRENEQSLFIPNLAYSGATGTRLSPKAISIW